MGIKKDVLLNYLLVGLLILGFLFMGKFGAYSGNATNEISCVDNDKDNIFTKGTVSWNGKRYIDSCVSGYFSTSVVEYACDGNKMKSKTIKCPDNRLCRYGACKQNPQKIKCVDSDGGKDLSVKGKVSIDGKSYLDYCQKDGSIREQICDKDKNNKPIRRNLKLKCSADERCIDGACETQEEPNQYSIRGECDLLVGDNKAQLKILFVNLGHAPHFDELVNDIINNQLKQISPFKENFDSIRFYFVEIAKETNMDCSDYGNGLSSGFVCNNEEVYAKIKEKCLVDDLGGIITVVVTETEFGGSGGDIIYLGSSSNRDAKTELKLSKNKAIHEIGHNFGLADLYYGIFYYSGQPSQFWPTDFSRAFLNVDGPGCKKWCGSFKSPLEYKQSISSQCLKFLDKQTCISFGRDQEKSCKYNENAPNCCVWSDEKFEYFNTNCVPAFGSENIGLNCLEGSGCYFGAVYGNYVWRPVLNPKDSIMFDDFGSNKFDSVSQRELNHIFNCCLSPNSASKDCIPFRKEYSDFLQNYNFKKRIGSCGYKN